jgi:hypothetical protein
VGYLNKLDCLYFLGNIMFKKFTDEFKGIRHGNQWHKKHGPSAPKVGDIAPDFCIADVTGENPIRLSDFIDKRPVALVFGSFT